MRIFLLILIVMTISPAGVSGFTTLKGTESGAAARWAVPAVGIELDVVRSPLEREALEQEVYESYSLWTDLPCTPPTLHVQNEAPENTYGVDGINRVLWIDIGWPGSPGELALTLVTRDKVSGEIVDADILMNQQHFSFTQDSTLPLPWVQIRGVLGHEFGHFLGMDHSEFDGALMTATVADNEELPTATGPDDEAGMCSLYGKTAFLAEDVSEGNGVYLLNWPVASPPQEGLIALWFFALLGLSLTQRRHGFLWLPLVVGMACITPDSHMDSADADPQEPADAENGSPDAQDTVEVEGDMGADSGIHDQWATIPPSELAGTTFLMEKLSYQQPLLESAISVSMFGLEGITFEEDGTFARFGLDLDGEDRCGERGTWTSRNNALVLRVDPFIATCASDALPQEDEFQVSRSVHGAVRLSRIGGNWRFGTSLLPLNYSLEMKEGQALHDCHGASKGECTMYCTEGGLFEVDCEQASWVGFCQESGDLVTCTGPCGVVVCQKDEWKSCAEDKVGMVCEP